VGLEVLRVDSASEIPSGAAMVVFDPSPSIAELKARASQWDAEGTVVVVCVPCTEPAAVRAWTEAGASALCRPHVDDAVVSSWLERLYREHQPSPAAFLMRVASRLENCALTVRTLEQAEAAAELLALTLPNPVLRVAGILELLLNAIEHGNLNLSADEKQQLLRTGQWHKEIKRRLETSPWRERVVRVSMVRTPGQWELVVVDEGEGFAFEALRPVSPLQLHGRGISMARGVFDTVHWEGRGNHVVARVVLP
jgi:anti-sigma regulatory factor (Ser/Thr protein kinase)